jgi:enamine deaminase RidA (YjgF/YER057c/UK114 family)
MEVVIEGVTLTGDGGESCLRGVVGSLWSDADADYCLLAGILPAELADQRGVQTHSFLEQIEAALQTVGMDFSHVVRTWSFLDDLLAWYDEFNAARTGFFQSRGVFDRLVPASTGIGAGNPAGAALAADALAIRLRHSRVRFHEVDSPLQHVAEPMAASAGNSSAHIGKLKPGQNLPPCVPRITRLLWRER